MITEEDIIEQAFAPFASDDADWEDYKERRAGLRALLLSYAAQERERCAQIVEHFDSSALAYRTYNDGVLRSGIANAIRSDIRAPEGP